MHSDPSMTEYDGRMSDGRTAASTAVRVRFSDSGLTIRSPAVPHPMIWPYATLDTAEPIRRKASDVLITSSEMTGATLFVDNANFAGSLLARASHLSPASLRWRYVKPGLAVLATLALIAGVVWIFDLSPARSIAGVMNEGTRVRMGQMVVQSMTANRTVCHTDEGRAALDKLTARLSAVSGAQSKFSVIVVNWDLLNAFAAPGSQIVLTREIIEDAKSPDEIAGVIAHEMGHGLELHPETGLVRAIGISAAIELMSGGSSGTLANMAGLLAQLSYTRSAEREADQHALRILKSSQISPEGLADFFKRISDLEDEGEVSPTSTKDEGESAAKDKDAAEATDKKEKSAFSRYINIDVLRTHPQSSERRKLIEATAKYDSNPPLSDSEWHALREICKTADDPNKDGKSETEADAK